MRKQQGVAERKFHEREEKKKREVEHTGDLLRGFDEAQAWLNGIAFAVIKEGRRRV